MVSFLCLGSLVEKFFLLKFVLLLHNVISLFLVKLAFTPRNVSVEIVIEFDLKL